MINSLTVADNGNKLRVILDCRYINPSLYKGGVEPTLPKGFSSITFEKNNLENQTLHNVTLIIYIHRRI